MECVLKHHSKPSCLYSRMVSAGEDPAGSSPFGSQSTPIKNNTALLQQHQAHGQAAVHRRNSYFHNQGPRFWFMNNSLLGFKSLLPRDKNVWRRHLQNNK